MAWYRKVDIRIWNDEKFMKLSRDAKLVFLFLLTHPHQTMVGAMRANIPGLAAELLMPLPDFRKAFQLILDAEMVQFDERASFVWLPNWLRYNRPESPSVVKAWPAAFELLPECNLKRKLALRTEAFLEGLPPGWRGLSRQGVPHQEQKQEQELKPSPFPPPLSGAGATSSGPIPNRKSKRDDLTVRQLRHLNEEIFRSMQDPRVDFDTALETACGRLLLPLDQARAAAKAAGIDGKKPQRKASG